MGDPLLSPSNWAHETDPKWTQARHHLLINDAITDLIDGRLGVPILVCELPVRHGKSEFLSNHALAWHTCRYPEQQRLLGSATDRLAARWSRKARHAVRLHGPKHGVRISDDKDTATEWETTAGGGLVTAGIGGDFMGRDLHFGCVDDYMKNSEAALSPTIREKQWDWFQSVMLARLEPGGSIVVFGTRWHMDDLIGCITGESDLNDEPLPHKRIHLPAICEDEDDPLGRKVGEALWPDRWPVGDAHEQSLNTWGKITIGLAMRRRITDDYWWAAVYQQRPTQHGKTIWAADYFDRVLTTKWPGSFEVSALAVDPAEGTRSGSDSAGVFVGMAGGLLWFDADVYRESVERTIERALDRCEETRPSFVGCEVNKHGSLVLTEWVRQSADRKIVPIPLHGIHNVASKPVRIMRWGGLLKTGVVRIRDTVGGRQLLRQLKSFGATDRLDAADAGEMAFRLLSGDVTDRMTTEATAGQVAY